MRDRLVSMIAIVLLAVVLMTSYWYSQSLLVVSGTGAPRAGSVDFFAEGIALTQFDLLGRARYKLFADRMTHYPDSDDVDMTQPRMVSLRPDQPQVRASALAAHVENNGERILLNGDVVITRAADGPQPSMRIETQALLALPDSDRYSTDQPVQVDRGSAQVKAVGMDFDNIARRVVFQSDVRSLIAPREPR
ncbi:MAG TPA: LPS export ABC transporter periplasmic protein LptC [Burkholderiaceae bacterium]